MSAMESYAKKLEEIAAMGAIFHDEQDYEDKELTESSLNNEDTESSGYSYLY